MPKPEKRSWKPGWYGDRLHAVSENPRFALCSFRFPPRCPDGEWFKRKVEKGIPRCKKCVSVIEKQEETE